jgi:hypothetical protein
VIQGCQILPNIPTVKISFSQAIFSVDLGAAIPVLAAMVIAAFALLIFVVSPAHALSTIVATIALGEVQVIGIQAKKNADISWEGNPVAQSNKWGTFHFSTTNLPQDCVGERSDGTNTIDVVVKDCTIEQVVGGGVLKTGQTASYAAGDDGDIQAGTPVPSPRFTDNDDGTVTDNLTGLIWLKDAGCLGILNWANALAAANALADGDVACGLTDGSSAGDWHLPNRNEYISLFDLENYNPALPAGNPFINFAASIYWSSTTLATDSSLAWVVGFLNGGMNFGNKTNNNDVTAVRGGS